jgi:hypothetical protein
MFAKLLSRFRRKAPAIGVVVADGPAAGPTVAVAESGADGGPLPGHHPGCRGVHGNCTSCGAVGVCTIPMRGSGLSRCTSCFAAF